MVVVLPMGHKVLYNNNKIKIIIIDVNKCILYYTALLIIIIINNGVTCNIASSERIIITIHANAFTSLQIKH